MPIDFFFRTLGDVYHANAIGIVLSGTGADGIIGLRRIKENGGIALAQDPAEAEYDGMPRSAIEAGVVDLILPVAEMPGRLMALRQGAARSKLVLSSEKLNSDADADALREVFALLRVRTGHDFSHYKRSTVLRHIARRVQLHELESIAAYLIYLREHPGEAQGLFGELLISVTNFFRDHESFQALERLVLPKLCADKPPGEQVRVWVPACATGEEAYSLAILLQEQVLQLGREPDFQIFATDVYEESIAAAREGLHRAECEIRSNDNRWHILRISPYRTSDDRIDGVVLAFVDVTARKLAEARVRESEERLRLAVEAAAMGMWEWDILSDRAMLDEPLRQMLGLRPEAATISFAEFQLFIHPDDRALVRARLQQALTAGKRVEVEYRVLPPEGGWRWIMGCGLVVQPAAGKSPRMIGVSFDSTLRKEAEEVLRQSRDELVTLVQARTSELEATNQTLQAEVVERRAAEAQVKELLHRVVNLQENERRRIAFELHDQLGQQLTALQLQLKSAQEQSAVGGARWMKLF